MTNYIAPEETTLTPNEITALRERAEAALAQLEAARATILHDSEIARVLLKRAEAAEAELAKYQAVAESEQTSVLDGWISRATAAEARALKAEFGWGAEEVAHGRTREELQAAEARAAELQSMPDEVAANHLKNLLHLGDAFIRIVELERLLDIATLEREQWRAEAMAAQAQAVQFNSFAQWCLAEMPPRDTYGFLSEIERRLISLSAAPASSARVEYVQALEVAAKSLEKAALSALSLGKSALSARWVRVELQDAVDKYESTVEAAKGGER